MRKEREKDRGYVSAVLLKGHYSCQPGDLLVDPSAAEKTRGRNQPLINQQHGLGGTKKTQEDRKYS